MHSQKNVLCVNVTLILPYRCTTVCFKLRLKELGEPLESITVTHLAHDRAHVQFNRTNGGRPVTSGLFAISLVQTQLVPQVLLRGRRAQVNLVAQHQEGHVCQLVRQKQGLSREKEKNENETVRIVITLTSAG